VRRKGRVEKEGGGEGFKEGQRMTHKDSCSALMTEFFKAV
jgi:hypothetical protein